MQFIDYVSQFFEEWVFWYSRALFTSASVTTPLLQAQFLLVVFFYHPYYFLLLVNILITNISMYNLYFYLLGFFRISYNYVDWYYLLVYIVYRYCFVDVLKTSTCVAIFTWFLYIPLSFSLYTYVVPSSNTIVFAFWSTFASELFLYLL